MDTKVKKRILLFGWLAAVVMAAVILICVMPVKAEGEHVHDGKTFIAWDKTDSLPQDAGSYYLTNDIVLTHTWNVNKADIDLCLNGHVIRQMGTGQSVINVEEYALCLYDCDLRPESDRTHKGIINADIWKLDESATEEKTVSIIGGVITGGTAIRGAGIYIGNRGKLIMNGGTIAGNKSNIADNRDAYKCGGGLFISSNAGNISLKNTQIVFNFATRYGGGVFNQAIKETVAIENSTIGNNTVEYDGGGIYLEGSAQVIIEDNTKIIGNKASVNGGGVRIKGTSNATIENSIIKGNTAQYGGGVFSEQTSNNFWIINTEISHNSASRNGGGINIAEKGSVAITHSIISDNSGDYSGGGICCAGNLILTDSKITGNCTKGDGGGIYGVHNTTSGNIQLQNDEITGNMADSYGSGIYNDGIIITMAGNMIINNNSGNHFGDYCTVEDKTIISNLLTNIEPIHFTTIKFVNSIKYLCVGRLTTDYGAKNPGADLYQHFQYVNNSEGNRFTQAWGNSTSGSLQDDAPHDEIWVVDTEKTLPRFDTMSATLGDTITMNFDMDIPDDFKTDGKMFFEIAGQQMDDVNLLKEQQPQDFNENRKQENGLYRFSCPVSSIQLADQITATYHFKIGNTEHQISRSISVEDYLKTIANGDYSMETKELAKAIGAYGYHVQQELNGQRGWVLYTDAPISDGHKKIDAMFADIEIGQLSPDEFWEQYPVVINAPDDLPIGISLSYGSCTEINLYIFTDENVTAKVTLNNSDAEIKSTVVNEVAYNRWKVTIPQILMNDLGKVYDVEMKVGETDVKLSALSPFVFGALLGETDTLELHSINALLNCYNKSMEYVK